MTKLDTDWAFAQYERVRPVLPEAQFPATSKTISHMEELIDEIDVFLLDAFGVLNIGASVIPGAPEWVSHLQSLGKQVLVVANGATYSPSNSREKYLEFGFKFAQADIISSRNILSDALKDRPEKLWGVMSATGGAIDELPVNVVQLEFDQKDFDRVEGFVFLGAGEWQKTQQDMLVASLQNNPRPVMVGNPDIVAPREEGFTLEPGWFAHEVSRQCSVKPLFFGKPFANIYDAALGRVTEGVAKSRIAMVGDTLHTDVLGGAAAGVKTVLMADYGLFAGKDVAPYIRRSGIVPHWIVSK